MKYVKSRVEIIQQGNSVEDMFRHIEQCGRISYKSEDRITEDSYGKFISMLEEKEHLSVLEHGTVYLTIPKNVDCFVEECAKVLDSCYAHVEQDDENYYVTTNYRVVHPYGMEFLKTFWSDMTEHVARVTIGVTCSRGVGYELVRHRVMSFTQESTRYCNYSKGKFDHQLTFIIPSWITDLKDGEQFTKADLEPDKLIKSMLSVEDSKSPKTMILTSGHICAEECYMQLLSLGCKPQEARDVLPNGLKTELAISGTIPQWKHLLHLRSAKCGAVGVHPDTVKVADAIYEALRNQYIPILNEKKD